jgi:hypothetical protein
MGEIDPQYVQIESVLAGAIPHGYQYFASSADIVASLQPLYQLTAAVTEAVELPPRMPSALDSLMPGLGPCQQSAYLAGEAEVVGTWNVVD